MQLIRRTAENAFASISFPDLQLYRRRYYSSSFWPKRNWSFKILFALYCLESELKYRSTADKLSPRIDEVEHPVVRPNTGVNPFIHANTLGITPPSLVFGSR